MHEISIARNIVKIISEKIENESLENVKQINLNIGKFSGINISSLQFSYQAIVDKTNLQNSKLQIIEKDFVIYCKNCKTNSTSEIGMLVCGNCNSYNVEIVSGKELEIFSIEI